MRDRAVRPPLLPSLLLRLSLPRGIVRDSILGDFWELHRRRALSASRARARLWYWQQALGLGGRALLDRLPGSARRHDRRERAARASSPSSGSGPGASRRPEPDGNTSAGLRAWARDFVYAVRTLRDRPGFVLVSVAVLATGIGAATVMFSTLNGVVLRQLPYEQPDRLVWFWSTSGSGSVNSSSALDYYDYRKRADVFEALGARLVFNPGRVITGGEEPERVPSTMVSANFFSMLGVEPFMGRTFTPDEAMDGGPRVVLLSHAYWQRRFGDDTGAVGSTMTIDGEPHVIIGVMPADYWYPRRVEMWFPMRRGDSWTSGRSNRNFFLIGRLASDTTFREAQAQVGVLAEQLAEAYAEDNGSWGARIEPLHMRFFGDVFGALLMLAGAVATFLAIACANLSSLVLARVTSRRQEIAVRYALGAPRVAIVRQLFAESALIAVAGSGAGLVAARFGIDAVRAFGPDGLPRLDTVTLDGRVLAFTALVTVLTALLVGLLPALRSTRGGLARHLKEGGSSSDDASSLRTRNALVVAQLALSLTLLIGSALLIRSYLRLADVDPGFDPTGVIALDLQPPAAHYDSPEGLVQFFNEVQEAVEAIPGVVDASGSTYLPPSGGPWNAVRRADRPPPDPSEQPRAIRRRVLDGYFETLRIPLLAGRTFESIDVVGSPWAVVVSRELAAVYYPGEEALGETLILPWGDGIPLEIIGIVENVSDYGVGAAPSSIFYLSARQFTPRALRLVVRAAGDPTAVVNAVRTTVWQLDDEVPISNVSTMDTLLSASTAQRRFQTTLLGAFAAVALLMASVGLYGVLAYFVSQRTHEVGIRMALGASPGNVMTVVVRRGMSIAGIGLGLGLLGGLSVSVILQSALFDTAPVDPLTYLVVTSALALAALAACVVPARRAVRVDPVIALRAE